MPLAMFLTFPANPRARGGQHFVLRLPGYSVGNNFGKRRRSSDSLSNAVSRPRLEFGDPRQVFPLVPVTDHNRRKPHQRTIPSLVRIARPGHRIAITFETAERA